MELSRHERPKRSGQYTTAETVIVGIGRDVVVRVLGDIAVHFTGQRGRPAVEKTALANGQGPGFAGAVIFLLTTLACFGRLERGSAEGQSGNRDNGCQNRAAHKILADLESRGISDDTVPVIFPLHRGHGTKFPFRRGLKLEHVAAPGQ